MPDILKECRKALKHVDYAQVNATVTALQQAERIFCVGNGGGYAHAMHFASDLRKIAHKQAFSFDNVAEMTARINDDGWEKAWADWAFDLGVDASHDTWFLFSVGGRTDGVSQNLPMARRGIVGANGGYHSRIVIPSTSTPVVEGCQSVIAHHLVEQLA